MTDSASPSGDHSSPDKPTSQRRRSRRRPRRRGQSQSRNQPSASPQNQSGNEQGSDATKDSKDSHQPGSRKRSRRRSSRGGRGRGGQNRNKQPQNVSDKQSGEKPGDSSPQSTNQSTKQTGESKRGGRGGKNRRGGRGRGRNQQNQSQNRARSKQSRPKQRSQENSRMVTRDETSAGGLVVSGLAEAVRSDGKVDLSAIYVALIGRLDRRGRLLWSMPKGHVENGEDRAATAEREVWEETGIYGEVITELGVIDYWFVSDGVRIHKTVHHHLLRFVDGDLNDEDPEVTEVAWIPASELIEHLAYADERKLARIAHDRLPELARKEHAEGRATPR